MRGFEGDEAFSNCKGFTCTRTLKLNTHTNTQMKKKCKHAQNANAELKMIARVPGAVCLSVSVESVAL